MDKMQQILVSAMQGKGKPPSGDTAQKDTAKGLQEAMNRAVKRFQSEHPNASKRPFGNQAKEAREKRVKARKDPMSDKNHFSSPVLYNRFNFKDVEEATFNKSNQYPKWANFNVARMVKKAKMLGKRGGGELGALMDAHKRGLPLNKAQKIKVMKAKMKK